MDTLAAAPPTSGDAAGVPAQAPWRLGLAIATVAFLVRLVPAALAYGTSDVSTWELLGRLLLSGDNFYATQLHNWPVLWIYFCSAAVLIHDASGLPFFTLIKLPPIAADAAIALLLYHWSFRTERSPRWAATIALAYALNPVSILISGYHGQFDSLMLAPTVLACWLISNEPTKPLRRELQTVPDGGALTTLAPAQSQDDVGTFGGPQLACSALALGLGIWFKPVPLLLLPILLPRLRTWRRRMLFTVLAVAPATLGTLPYFVRWPNDVAENFFGYSSWFGQWGYPVAWMVVEYVRNGTIPWWLPDPEFVSRPLHLMYLAGRYVLVAALAATWWLIYRRRMELLRAISATFAVFYFATSGFGVQYLLWIIPFATARRDRWLWPFTLAATVLLVVAYSLGAAYMPMETIPDNAPSAREFLVKLATLPTWIASGLWAWSLIFRQSTRPENA
ncbi:MAG: hypothetical protein JO020_21875 [Chloroflexi bacterium]|nr:hypothetical protein [Chloroflexota bacterium]